MFLFIGRLCTSVVQYLHVGSEILHKKNIWPKNDNVARILKEIDTIMASSKRLKLSKFAEGGINWEMVWFGAWSKNVIRSLNF
jgi:hypothetical protein